MSHGESKIALVLAGGGLAGAVYEIGALRAIDDLLLDRTVNDLDIYVGTSAGAVIASALANKLSPEDMLQAFEGIDPQVKPLRRGHLFQLNTREFFQRALALPRTLWGAWSHYMRHADDMNFVDLLLSLTEAMPSGMYNVLALEAYVRSLLEGPGCCNDFDGLEPELYIIATDLDTGKRAVFGQGAETGVSISRAVAASAALPLVYKPVRIGDRDLVDGGLRGTASLDLAIERGANLVICINPLVPYDNRAKDSIPFLGPDGGYLSDKGAQFIASQTIRIFTHSGLHYHIKQLRRQHPRVDIILIEPQADDAEMFFHNIMRYSSRLTVARHGFESVTLDLAEDYARYKEILARHGVPISRRLVIAELAEIQGSGYDPEVIRSILETKPPGSSRRGRETTSRRLSRILADLDSVLNKRKVAKG